MVTVLLADSQPLFNEALEALSSRDDVHQVIGRCSSAEDAFTHVSGRCPDLVLIDAVLVWRAHPHLVTRVRQACPQAWVIVPGPTSGTSWRSSACIPSWRPPPSPCSARWSSS
jgi:DNA-binding NarL/FixJ family response regulator